MAFADTNIFSQTNDVYVSAQVNQIASVIFMQIQGFESQYYNK